MVRKIPIIVVVIYVILVVLATIPIFTGDDALSGIFAVVLTLPWSSMLGNLLSGGSVILGVLVIVVGAAINATILYFISRWLVGRLVR